MFQGRIGGGGGRGLAERQLGLGAGVLAEDGQYVVFEVSLNPFFLESYFDDF